MSENNGPGDYTNAQHQEIAPGDRLRIAREESGLSRSAVASHLKLSDEKIASLERGEVDDLAAPVFVAGYLRAYARLVGLSEEEIIADFKALSSMQSPSMDPSSSPAANNYGQMASSSGVKGIRNKEKDWGPVAIWGSIAIVLAVILFIVFTGNDSDTVGNVGGETNKIESGTLPENSDDNKNLTIINTNKENISTVINTGEDVAKRSAAEDNAVTETDEPDASEKLSENIDQRDLKHSVIVFDFRDDSWIEVKDAMDKRLLYRLGKAGTSRTVWGVSPFSVQLGYASGVEIIFNGEPYDMSRFANRRSVLFSLGKKGDSMSSN